MKKIEKKVLALLIFSYLGSLAYFLLLTGKPVFSAGVSLFTAALLPFFRKYLERKKKGRMILEFQDMIYFLDSGLKAGKSFDNSLKKAKDDLVDIYGADGLLAGELEKVVYLAGIGVSYDQGFLMLEARYQTGLFKDLGQVLEITRNMGGSLRDVLGRTNAILSERLETELEIGSMMARQRLEVNILRAVPFVMLLGLKLVYPEMIVFISEDVAGMLTFAAAGILFGASFYLSHRLMEVAWY